MCVCTRVCIHVCRVYACVCTAHTPFIFCVYIWSWDFTHTSANWVKCTQMPKCTLPSNSLSWENSPADICKHWRERVRAFLQRIGIKQCNDQHDNNDQMPMIMITSMSPVSWWSSPSHQQCPLSPRIPPRLLDEPASTDERSTSSPLSSPLSSSSL